MTDHLIRQLDDTQLIMLLLAVIAKSLPAKAKGESLTLLADEAARRCHGFITSEEQR